MEMLKLVLLFLLLTNVFCLNGDKQTSQIKSEKSDLIEDILTRMARKPPPPPPRRFFKKNTAARSLAARKLHRFQTFVGLMGKRS
ncbi:protachykinin [Syngnathus acus]|uniref:protachykinin n=1 Tax=Syngnathus acus TaxID=161584 RepID=UPI0018861FC9|nr:protachykinin [Syngnathus acus]